MQRQLPSINILRKLLRYEPETGKMFWKTRPLELFNETEKRTARHACAQWNSKLAGKEAICTQHGSGYLCGDIFANKYFAHHVAWALFYGSSCLQEIDHINGVKSDNRISNLREATHTQNLCNVGITSRNTSGLKGAFWHKRDRVWEAHIRVNTTLKYLGRYSTKEDAHKAYCDAANKYHGEFARLS